MTVRAFLLLLPFVGLGLSLALTGGEPPKRATEDPVAEQPVAPEVQAPAVLAADAELREALTLAQKSPPAERAAHMDRVYALAGSFLDAHAAAATPRQLELAARYWFQLAEQRGEHDAMRRRIAELRGSAALSEDMRRKLGIYSALLDTAVGTKAPSWTAARLDGAKLASSSLKGRTTLLSFWATWNPHCRDLIRKRLKRMAVRHPRLALVHVGVPGNGETVAKEQAHFERSPCAGDPLFDASGELAGMFGVDAVPVLVLIDEEGRIVVRGPGWEVVDEVERQLAR